MVSLWDFRLKHAYNDSVVRHWAHDFVLVNRCCDSFSVFLCFFSIETHWDNHFSAIVRNKDAGNDEQERERRIMRYLLWRMTKRMKDEKYTPMIGRRTSDFPYLTYHVEIKWLINGRKKKFSVWSALRYKTTTSYLYFMTTCEITGRKSRQTRKELRRTNGWKW